MNTRAIHAICLLCLTLIAVMSLSRPADAQATVVFTSPAAVTIDQGTSLVDFYGQINNTQAGAVTIAPAFINISGSVPSTTITAYDTFGPTNNLPATVAAGTVSSSLEFFSVDTSSLNPGTYSGALVLTDSNDSTLTNPANFSITVTPAPEPSILTGLTLGAAGLGFLIARTRRSRAD